MKSRPIRSLILQFTRELRGVEQEELGEKVGYEESVIASWERGEEDPGRETLELLMGALGVSEWILDELEAVAEEIREVEIEDRWIGAVHISGSQLRSAGRESVRFGNLMRRNFHRDLLEAYVLSETEEREGGSQAGPTPDDPPESVS